MQKYIDLIRSFVKGDIVASDFERCYLKVFKTETGDLSEDKFEVLDSLFASVDSFCAEEELRDEDDIDENELLRDANNALRYLESMGSP